ncbi:MAG: RDD family protein [Elusimicrobia bacterium]|nr:RDD family protein [Elusimicrobiota bacterium]
MEAENFEFAPATFQEPAEPEFQGPAPAGFNERFVAYAVDAAPFIFGAYSTFSLLLKNGVMKYSAANELKWKLLWVAAYIVYETVLSSGGRATLGKCLLGIRVKAADGVSELSMPGAFIRSIGYFVSSVLVNLGYVLALFTPDNRALHDYIARSRVISVREKSDLADGFILAVSWALMVILAGSWANQNFLKVTPDEKAQVLAARTTVGKIARLEEIHKELYGGYTDELKRLAFLTHNVEAVRKEINKNIEPNTLAIASDGRAYIITAKARNWRHTEVRRESIPK